MNPQLKKNACFSFTLNKPAGTLFWAGCYRMCLLAKIRSNCFGPIIAQHYFSLESLECGKQ